jgi:hypothetical protein
MLQSGTAAPACTDNFQVMTFTFDGKEWQSCEQCYQVSTATYSEFVIAPHRRLTLGRRRAKASTLLTLSPSAAYIKNRCIPASYSEKNDGLIQ